MTYRPGPFALNGICAYFTMFPLSFPIEVLEGRAQPGEIVLDPFCGRGTTNYASRVLGLTSFGIDSNPVAVALSEAKLANTTPAALIAEARRLLLSHPVPSTVPTGEFWQWAYHPQVLDTICRLRDGLLDMGASPPAAVGLRAVILGALHGPRPKCQPSNYLSNQCQRTYAPKPRYAVKYWRSRDMPPRRVNVMRVIKTRAERYFAGEESLGRGRIGMGDSRVPGCFRSLLGDRRADWVISSPPYYGLDTYYPDQWLRHWFLGGPDTVRYESPKQVDHHSPRSYIAQLRNVWRNASEVASRDARLVVRFGGIRDRKVSPLTLIEASLHESGWSITQVRSAGKANRGKRQAQQFPGVAAEALDEYDIWAVRD